MRGFDVVVGWRLRLSVVPVTVGPIRRLRAVWLRWQSVLLCEFVDVGCVDCRSNVCVDAR